MNIISAEYIISNVDWEKCPPPVLPEYAFIGRSNVGKSSVINMLTGRSKLAKISGHPGKTQTINHFLINESWYLVDLPGYGFAKVSQAQRKNWETMIENYLRRRANLVNVFILIDSRLSPQKIDLDFINQLGAWEIPFIILFTKADKNSQLETSRNVKNFLNKMKERWEHLPLYFITSALKKTGRENILQYIEEWNERFRAIA